jgi:uncharacterized membrane protein YeaQ/YmgE (transglycosylase-associated protein family)
MVNSLDALRISGVKAWWLDRLYTDWTVEPVAGGTEGWRAIIAKPEMRLLAFLTIGMGVGLIFRSREDSITVNIIVSAIGAFAGGFGFRFLVSFVGMSLYSPYASLIAAFIGAIALVFVKRAFNYIRL